MNCSAPTNWSKTVNYHDPPPPLNEIWLVPSRTPKCRAPMSHLWGSHLGWGHSNWVWFFRIINFRGIIGIYVKYYTCILVMTPCCNLISSQSGLDISNQFQKLNCRIVVFLCMIGMSGCRKKTTTMIDVWSGCCRFPTGSCRTGIRTRGELSAHSLLIARSRKKIGQWKKSNQNRNGKKCQFF